MFGFNKSKKSDTDKKVSEGEVKGVALKLLKKLKKPNKDKSADASDTDKKVSEEELKDKYVKHYDKNVAFKLLKKLRGATMDKPAVISGTVGAIVEVLGKLLSALDNPQTPAPMKALIMGAIGYIVLPVDLIPDMVPVVGYADDLASTAGVVAAVAAYSTFNMEELDREILRDAIEAIEATKKELK